MIEHLTQKSPQLSPATHPLDTFSIIILTAVNRVVGYASPRRAWERRLRTLAPRRDWSSSRRRWAPPRTASPACSPGTMACAPSAHPLANWPARQRTLLAPGYLRRDKTRGMGFRTIAAALRRFVRMMDGREQPSAKMEFKGAFTRIWGSRGDGDWF